MSRLDRPDLDAITFAAAADAREPDDEWALGCEAAMPYLTDAGAATDGSDLPAATPGPLP